MGADRTAGTVGHRDVQLFLCNFVCVQFLSSGSLSTAQKRRCDYGNPAGMLSCGAGSCAKPLPDFLFYCGEYR